MNIYQAAVESIPDLHCCDFLWISEIPRHKLEPLYPSLPVSTKEQTRPGRDIEGRAALTLQLRRLRRSRRSQYKAHILLRRRQRRVKVGVINPGYQDASIGQFYRGRLSLCRGRCYW